MIKIKMEAAQLIRQGLTQLGHCYTVEEIEQQIRLWLERWERHLELVEAYQNGHITSNELEEALLALGNSGHGPGPELGGE